MPVNTTEPLPTAGNAAAIKSDAIVTVYGSGLLLPTQWPRHPKSSHSLRWLMRSRLTRRLCSPSSLPFARASASRKSRNNFRPGLVIGQAATSFSACRCGHLSKNSVPARVVWRYGEFDNGKHDSNCGGDGAAGFNIVAIGDHPHQARSCRRVLRNPALRNKVHVPPKPRRKRVGRAVRSPVSLLGMGCLWTRSAHG